MVSLLHSLRAIAAPRGDGLHPELCKRSFTMDAEKINELSADHNELEQRRNLASAREARECERKALLIALLEWERQADQLRAWIARRESQLKPEVGDELSRMLRWAKDELRAIESVSEPARLVATLRKDDLFPEIDKLADPLGDPPPLRPWGT